MAQHDGGIYGAYYLIYGTLQVEHKANKEDFPIHQDTGAKPTRIFTNEAIGGLLQHSPHQEHRSAKQCIATNLTGQCPVIFNRGDNYLFVLYDNNNNKNSILVCPMNSRTEK